MSRKLRLAAFASILSSVAMALIVLPVTSQGATAATKKAKAPAMKSTKMKGAAPKSSGKGNSNDPLAPAAGKKM